MKISALLQGIKTRGPLPQDVEITGIQTDSRLVGPGDLFVCISGGRVDGHRFAAEAFRRGAAAVVSQNVTEGPQTVLVADSRKAYALLCANFFGRPSSRLRLAGITGTNGKTSSASLLRQILEKSGEKTGLLGTIENIAGDYSVQSHYTTPDPFELEAFLQRMVEQGCRYAVAEVSSQALDQQRLYGLEFCCAAFTNLSREHLDYHGSMESYYQAKRRLFEMCRTAVINIDDTWGARLTRETPCRTVSVSSRYPLADYLFSDISHGREGASFLLRTREGLFDCFLPLFGFYNVYNAVTAIACAVEMGVDPREAVEAVKKAAQVKGRLERVPTPGDYAVFIDYAHTPDGLMKVLRALRGVCRGRLICLFGCGGDRDAEKRPLMGKAAAENSDFVVVTSDNPRTEDPSAIIADILPGMRGTNTPYVVAEEREEAIARALREARKGDVVLLAGKGHEDYQIRREGKVHFDEREIVARLLAAVE